MSELLKKVPVGNVTLGVVAGFCSAYAMRAIGRTLAIAVGVVFLGLQGLQHAGYITINWGKAEQKMVATFDQDGDGKLTKDDLHSAKNRILPIITKGLPGTGGFVAGFVIALKFF